MLDKAAGIFRHSASHTGVKVDPRQHRNKQKGSLCMLMND